MSSDAFICHIFYVTKIGYRKFKYNEDVFLNEDNISYYLLGAFMSDGCVYILKGTENKLVSLYSNDKQWVDDINELISPNKPLFIQRKTCYFVQYSSNNIADWLIKNNCVPKKSSVLQFPPNIPKEYIGDFLRGCWDGDGSISFHKKTTNYRAYLASGSKIFCEQVRDSLLINFNIKSLIAERKIPERKIKERILKPTISWTLIINRRDDVYNFLKLIYPNNFKLCLKRKYKIALEIIKDHEMKFYCKDCKIEISRAKNGIKERCSDCAKKQSKKLHKEKYELKKKNKILLLVK